MPKYAILLFISLTAFILSDTQTLPKTGDFPQQAIEQATNSDRTVFLIMMENHDWSRIKGNPSAPYINNVLLPIASHAEQYYTPPHLHPSEPNYLWLEAGSNLGIANDNDPHDNHQSTPLHLVTLLDRAGISWKSYQEGSVAKSAR
jgi:hypothetical protein